ncbi:MAG: signal recognition particle [Lentilitoribacter sp.]
METSSRTVKALLPIILSASWLTNANSQDISKSIQLAQNLGNLIASEQYCDLSYSQEAIADFVEMNVSAEDMEFPSRLEGFITLSNFTLESKSLTAKMAHCTQITRLAKSHRFIK